jgi:hypothetical protein
MLYDKCKLDIGYDDNDPKLNKRQTPSLLTKEAKSSSTDTISVSFVVVVVFEILLNKKKKIHSC